MCRTEANSPGFLPGLPSLHNQRLFNDWVLGIRTHTHSYLDQNAITLRVCMCIALQAWDGACVGSGLGGSDMPQQEAVSRLAAACEVVQCLGADLYPDEAR